MGIDDYAVHYKDKFIGIFSGYSERDVKQKAWHSMGYAWNKYSSCIESDFLLIKL